MSIVFGKLKCQKGASSVLIILMMLVLVVFGLATLTTSLATLRLTKKSTDWTTEYYLLEAKAEELIYEVDSVLYDAEKKAVEYLEIAAYLDKTGKLFADEIQSNISVRYNNYLSDKMKEKYLEKVFQAVYYKSVVEGLRGKYPEAEIVYSGSYIRQILEDEKFDGIVFFVTLDESKEEFSKHIDVKIRLNATWFESGRERYEILEWREWQKAFEYSDGVKWTNPDGL